MLKEAAPPSHVLLFFSQNYTDEQISQRRTETLSQPISQSVSAIVKGSGPSPNPSPAGKGRSMWGYPYRAADKRIERSVQPHYRGISVITPLPFGGGVGGGAALSHVLLFLSQNYTEEQNSQRRTETLSQPISQNDITKISRKALWYLSSIAGVCGFSLFAERLLFICENLWEIEFPTSYHKKLAPWHQPWCQGQETKIKLPMYRHWYHINAFPLET